MTDSSLTDDELDREVDGDVAGEVDGEVAEELDGDVADELAEDAEDDGPDGNRIVGALARNMLEYVARSIVDDPDSVLVDVDDNRRGLILRLHVAPGDMGRIIGRRGRVAQAIRTVVRAAGAREGVEAIVDIVD